MVEVEGVLVVGISPIPETHFQETNQDQITNLIAVPTSELIRPLEHTPE